MRVKFLALPRPRFAGLSAEKRRDTGFPFAVAGQNRNRSNINNVASIKKSAAEGSTPGCRPGQGKRDRRA